MSKHGYTTGQWNGLPKFQCDTCPFETTSEEVIRDHVDGHKPAQKPSKAKDQKTDRFGNPVT